jgi:Bacterial DNA polymerase III alpha NTPase domain
MIELQNRIICDDGTVLLTVNAATELLYSGKSLDHACLLPDADVDLHNQAVRVLDSDLNALLTRAADHTQEAVDWSRRWLTPEPYASMDVLQHCLDRCSTAEQQQRTLDEHALFVSHGMTPVLRHLIYMVDSLRSRGVFWGVGRGSSVSSFILYLIGINRINPMDYGLDISEFLA